MDKLTEDFQSNQPHVKHFFEQVTNMMKNIGYAEPSSPQAYTCLNLPVQGAGTGSIPHAKATFMAFADAIIPSTLGALDLQLDEYIVWTLDHFVSIQGEWGLKTAPISSQTAMMLDAAAVQLIRSGNIKAHPDFSVHPNGGPFAALSPDNRFEAIRLLENILVDLEVLPLPFQNNAGLVKNIITSLHQMVLFGYYSEWFSLGSTRLADPENHRFERQRFVWNSLDYPGPALGYRAVRGYLVEKFLE